MEKKKLTVNLLNDSFPPQIDGVTNAVVNYANIIEEKYGHAIVSTPENPDAIDAYRFEVLRYPSLDTTKMVGYRAGLPLNLNYVSQFASKNIDILHSHCPIASNYLARAIRETIHRPIIMTYHTKFDIDIRKAIDSKVLQDAAIKLLVQNIEAVDEVWAVSRGAGENLKSLGYSGDYIVMPNGVDFTKGPASDKEIEQINYEYNLHAKKPVYLFVGRIMWYKGLKIILDALKTLDEKGQDFYMMFVGGGIDEQEVKDYAREIGVYNKCIFTGSVSDRSKLKALFSRADLFLFPSTFDTNGIVVREAAASGLASVLVKGSCAAEDTIDKQNCFWIEENADSLAKLLYDIGDNYELMHAIGTNAMNQLYTSWDESVERAYERYLYVNEKYQYDKPKPFDGVPFDQFFNLFGDIAAGLDKVHKASDEARTMGREFREEATSMLEEFMDRWL